MRVQLPLAPENVFKCDFVDDVVLTFEPVRLVLADKARVVTRVGRATVIHHSVQRIPATRTSVKHNTSCTAPQRIVAQNCSCHVVEIWSSTTNAKTKLSEHVCHTQKERSRLHLRMK